MTFTQELELDIFSQNTYRYINAKQADNITRYVKITMTANGQKIKPEPGVTAYFRALKADGKSVFDNAVVNDDGTVTVKLTEQALACPGTVHADVSLMKGDEALSTLSFYIQVEKAPVGSAVASSNEFLALVEATKKAESATDDANAAADAANTAASSANSAADAANAEAAHPGRIIDGTWHYWDRAKGQYVDTGIDGTVSLTIAEVITGEPGTKAEVENIGTDTDIKLKITIPRGDPGGVTSIKGAAETSYRTGDVNLTPADVGAVSKAGDTMTGDLYVSDGWVGLNYVPDNGGRVSVKAPPGFGVSSWSMDGYNGAFRIFSFNEDGSATFPFIISRIQGGGPSSGIVSVGNKVSMRTDNEGGNIGITPPDGYPNYWEIDAFDNGNLRFLNFEPGITSTPLVLRRNTVESFFAGEANRVSNPLTFTGGVNDSYNGSEPKTIRIPSTASDIGAPAMKDSELDWAVMEGHTPAGNTGGLYFNKGGFVYVAVSDAQGVQLFGQELYSTGHRPTPADIGAVSKAGDTMTGDLWVANGMAGLSNVPDNGGRLCLVSPPGVGTRDWNMDGYGGMLRFFAAKTDGTYFFPVVISETETAINNRLVVGGKVSMWTDGEGGNIGITPPDGYPNYWEIDAFDGGNLRFINFESDIRIPLILRRNAAESYFAGTSAYATTAGHATDGSWTAGERVTLTNVTLSAHVTNGMQAIPFCLPVGKPISAPGVRVTQFTGKLRGVQGYLDGNSDDVNLLGPPYGVNARSFGDAGMVRLEVTKSLAWTNTVNNTPVTFSGDITIEFSAVSDEPMPGPEIFGDGAGVEDPSMEEADTMEEAVTPESDETSEDGETMEEVVEV